MRSGFGSLSLCLLLAVAACDCDDAIGDPDGGTGGGCTSNADCTIPGQTCIDGMCTGGGTPDASVDADTGSGDTGDTGGGGEGCEDNDGDGRFGISAGCPSGDDCDDSRAEVYPGATELCGDGADNDCNGSVDGSDCSCTRGQRLNCYSGPVGTADVGECRAGVAICTAPGEVTECMGERLPTEEVETLCDGLDNNCDGRTDEGLRNACGECAPEPEEMCGDEIDNDCDGMVDEDCNCDYSCTCADTDPDCECIPPTNQPCYEGRFGSGSTGICGGGRRDCVEVGGEFRWGECLGQTLPEDECNGGLPNSQDDDCDGRVDEGCKDEDGDGSPWPQDCDDSDPDVNPDAAETCNGVDENCDGLVDDGVTNACGTCGDVPEEVCGNGLDDNCDGRVDEECECSDGAEQECYIGPDGTQGVGHCTAGTQTCAGGEFGAWGACTGARGPDLEVCDGEDNNCNGEADERWAIGSNDCGFCDGTEVCDGEDNDCDGEVDEGVANACGECGPAPVETCNEIDDDCDGAIDELTVNNCGLCQPAPCYDESYPRPADGCGMGGRTCEGVEEAPGGEGGVTLGEGSVDHDYIYLAVTGRNQIAQLNTVTGAKNWQVSSYGGSPSRTAVAADGSCWAGNRGTTNFNDVNQSNMIHLAVDGSLICRADIPGRVRGVAIDQQGHIWAGTFEGRKLWKVHRSNVDDTMSPPRCEILGDWDVGQNVYGLTADPDGFVWTASRPQTVRMNTDTGTFTTVANPGFYGISVGDGIIAHGDWSGRMGVHTFSTAPPHAMRTSPVRNVTGLVVHPNGRIYGSQYGENHMVGIDIATMAQVCRAPTPSGTNPHGAGVDRMGRIWVPNRYGGYVNVYGEDCNLLHTYPVDPGQEIYSYSDFTGLSRSVFTAPEGTWSQVFNSGYAGGFWSELTWDAVTPLNTNIEMFVQGASTLAGLDAAAQCGPYTSSPTDISMCPSLQNAQYIKVTARLTSTSSGFRPILSNVQVSGSYCSEGSMGCAP